MTAPADPREALARALELHMTDFIDQPESYDSSEMVADNLIRRLAEQGYTLAARQDEPSPALREALKDAAGWAHFFARHDLFRHLSDPYAFDECRQDQCPKWAAALAANPPQTREAEGAAFRRRPVVGLYPERTPEAQRDAPDRLAQIAAIEATLPEDGIAAGGVTLPLTGPYRGLLARRLYDAGLRATQPPAAGTEGGE